MLDVAPRRADRRILLALVVGVVVVALVLTGLAVADRVRGGASSPTSLAERVLTAADHEDLGALVRLVEPDERTALVRLVGAWSARFDALDLPPAVGGGAPAPTSAGSALDGLTLDVTGSAPRVAAESGDVAVVDLGAVAVRVRSDPPAARGLLRAWFAYRHTSGPQDRTYRGDTLPAVGALPRLVAVERSGRWYLSVLATLLGPDVANGPLPAVTTATPADAPDARGAVEATLRSLLDGRTRSDTSVLAGTLDASGADLLQLWSSEVATTGLDRSPVAVTALTTTDGPVDPAAQGRRAAVRVASLRVGDGSGVDLAGGCLSIDRRRTCLHPTGYRYAGGLGSLSAFDLLGRDGAFSATAVRGAAGWRTSVPESLADALVAYGDGLTRAQALMVLGEEHLDAPVGVLEPNRASEVTSPAGATRS